MQHAMVEDSDANASRGERQDKMMAAQPSPEVMTLFVVLAARLSSGLGGGISMVRSTHGVIHFDAGQPHQACAGKLIKPSAN
jgi:hypothetical protein